MDAYKALLKRSSALERLSGDQHNDDFLERLSKISVKRVVSSLPLPENSIVALPSPSSSTSNGCTGCKRMKTRKRKVPIAKRNFRRRRSARLKTNNQVPAGNLNDSMIMDFVKRYRKEATNYHFPLDVEGGGGGDEEESLELNYCGICFEECDRSLPDGVILQTSFHVFCKVCISQVKADTLLSGSFLKTTLVDRHITHQLKEQQRSDCV